MRRTVSLAAALTAVALLAGTVGVVVGTTAGRTAQAAPDPVAAAPDPCPNSIPFETGTGTLQGYLSLTGILGDSANAQYNKWIVVSKVRSDVVGAGVTGCGTQVAPLVVTKAMDRASVPIVQRSLAGTVIPTAQLAIVKPVSGTQFEFVRYTLTNVKVLSVSTQWKGSVPTEHLRLTFTKFCVAYRAQKSDGSAEPPVTACK